jgi:predicted  nucleic acid-binding Zn-ribbon protein
MPAARKVRKAMPSSRSRPAQPVKRGPTRAAATRKAMRTSPIRPPRAPRPSSSRAIKRAAANVATAAATAYAVGQLSRLNTVQAHPDIYYQVNSVQSSIEELENRAGMSEVRADITNLDANLNHAISLLESARDKGYAFQADLEDIAYDAMSRWQTIRADVEVSIEEQTKLAASYFGTVNRQINQLNSVLSNAVGAQDVLHQTESEIQQAMNAVSNAERTIESAYDDIEQQASLLIQRLTPIHWALTQKDEASFEFVEDEELYMAVKARWDQEGKDDPEGILFLTTKRLIFERKEKVATKKVLFVATAKELVQEVMGAQPVSGIENVKAQNKGVFGHQDFLAVDFGKQVVPFHLNGQDSSKWATWILNAKSGKLEEDRTSGSKLSFADLTGNITQADIVALQNEINELQDEMMLKETQDELSELENQIAELSRELSQLRARGYVIEKSLEVDIEVLTMQWEKIKKRANTTLNYQTNQLGEKMKAIQEAMAQLAGMSANLTAARPIYINIKSLIASAEAQAEAAEETVLDQYDEYADEIETLDAHLEWIDWMLDAISTASFKMLATESGVAALEAVWERPNGEPENGILYLTDQRLLWEDREGDYELKIDVPLPNLTEVKQKIDEEKGEQRLLATFDDSAPVSSTSFLFSQPVIEEWLKMIGRARAGDYSDDRAVEIEESELERIRNAPTQCSNCGAAFTAPLLRGQTEVTCEFCGTATRI